MGADYARVPIGDGLYTFHTDHLPKTDLRLGHPYLLSVQEQMHDSSFTLAWASYEYRNKQANLSYERRNEAIAEKERSEPEEAHAA